MLKRNDGQPGIINQYINNKYWFICSALFFLTAASVYLIFTPAYKVTTRIALNSNQNPEEVINNIKSKVLLQKVIDRLPPKKNNDGQLSIINRHINNKYWFIFSALFFCHSNASVYLNFHPQAYKVTTRIALNSNQYPEEVINNIKSKVLLQESRLVGYRCR